MAFSDFGSDETWQASVQLRFVIREIMVGGFNKRTEHLQQLWVSSSGKRAWKDVPTVEEY